MPQNRHLLLVAGLAALVAAGAFVVTNTHGSESALRALDHPAEGRSVDASLPRQHAGASGWRWQSGRPGFRFGSEERFWNGTELPASRREAIAAAARAADLSPEEVRVLKEAAATRSRDIVALVAAPAPDGSICLAFSGVGLPSRFTCMRGRSPAAASLSYLATLIANTKVDGRSVHTLDLLGVARGDVSSVEFAARGLGRWTVYKRSQEFIWGTFALGVELPRTWSGVLTIHRRGGSAVRLRLTSQLAGRRLLLPR